MKPELPRTQAVPKVGLELQNPTCAEFPVMRVEQDPPYPLLGKAPSVSPAGFSITRPRLTP